VFADPDLNVKTNNGVPVQSPTGYHKLKTVIKGDSKSDTEDGQQEYERCPTSFSSCSSRGMQPSSHQLSSRSYSADVATPSEFFSMPRTGENNFTDGSPLNYFGASAIPTATAGSFAMENDFMYTE
jgi:hypothetical protein